MTPGQIITAAQIAFAGAVLALAFRRRDEDVMFAALGLIAAISVTRLLKAGLPPDVAFVAWGALWVTVGGWIVTGGIGAGSKPVALAGGLAISTAFLDALSWITQARAVLWSPPVMLADCLVFAAIAALLWRSGGGGTRRMATRERFPRRVRGVVAVARVRRPVEAGEVDAQQRGGQVG